MNSGSGTMPPIDFIEDDFFHRDFDFCAPEIETIQVRFCMYSITYPFYVEGMPMIEETSNIYGRVFPEYNIRYPCLQWIATKNLRFPSITYECAATTEEEMEEKSQETIRFENEIHAFFLSFFRDDVYSADILGTAYKGFSYDDATTTAYVFYDFSHIQELLNNAQSQCVLALADELVENEPVFTKYPFLRKIKGYHSPALLYMCVYDADKKDYVNVDIDMSPSKYMFPQEHPILGCTAYYFTEAPISDDVSRLVRFACIQSRIMYEVRIEGEDVFYMGDNVGEFREEFDMGVLMCSTLHFEENGRRFIGIKAGEMIFPLGSLSTPTP